MSDLNPRVSNGTCYTASGKKLDSSFIPCGNDAFGRQTCCGRGDNCLADGACFGQYGSGYGSMLTYWAGCSDPDYKDASCPKKVVEQPWVALTYCTASHEWAICSQIGNPSTLQPGALCSCTDPAKATIAFKDSETLSNLVSLPQNTGDTMSFFQGYSPTATVPTAGGGKGGQTTSPAETGSRSTLEETSTVPPSRPPAGSTPSTSPSPTTSPIRSSDSSSGSSATTFTDKTTDAEGKTMTVTRTATAPPSNTNAGSNTGNGNGSSDSESGLNTGAKIGVGVGVAVGGVLLIALVLLLLRRRRNRPAKRMEEGSMPSEPKVPLADSAAIVEADGRPAKPHKLRGELGEGTVAAGKPPSSKLNKSHQQRASDASTVSELEGSLGGVGVAGAGHHQTSAGPDEGLAPVAELPGTDVQSGRNGRLASDDSLVPAPLQVHHGKEGRHAGPPATTSGPPGGGAAAGGTSAAERQNASEALHEGAQVKPWGARWRRT
ncbi:hypothetical protein PG995_007701 [Apiospora arundinis]